MDWEEYISEIASDIMKEQSPKRYISYVPFSVVFYTITNVSVSYTCGFSSYTLVGYFDTPFVIQMITMKLFLILKICCPTSHDITCHDIYSSRTSNYIKINNP